MPRLDLITRTQICPLLSAVLKSVSTHSTEPMQQYQILDWVSSIDVGSEPPSLSLTAAKTHQLQRKRPLPSPSMSSSNATSSTPSGKRPRIDPNRTPRANPQLSVSGSSDANSAASSSGYDIDYDETESMASKRTRSNKSSPTKTTHTLAYLHVEHVIQYKAFDGRESASAPASLKELVASIEADAFGQGIISDYDLVSPCLIGWLFCRLTAEK